MGCLVVGKKLIKQAYGKVSPRIWYLKLGRNLAYSGGMDDNQRLEYSVGEPRAGRGDVKITTVVTTDPVTWQSSHPVRTPSNRLINRQLPSRRTSQTVLGGPKADHKQRRFIASKESGAYEAASTSSLASPG